MIVAWTGFHDVIVALDGSDGLFGRKSTDIAEVFLGHKLLEGLGFLGRALDEELLEDCCPDLRESERRVNDTVGMEA